MLEIGCGTGQASGSLAERCSRLLAVELGPRLAAVATRRLVPYPAAEVVVADFDRWTGESGGFDLVFSATAFHWLDPATRFVATVASRRARAGRRPGRGADPPPGPADQVPFDTAVDAGFGRPEFHRFEWTAAYRTADYLDPLRTYSTTLAMSPPTAAGLLRCVGDLIDGRYGGRVAKRYLSELRVTRSPA